MHEISTRSPGATLVTLAPISAGVAQYADFQCMLTNSGVTYWAVVTTGTIS